ncbi:hypothetical protein [Paenibacillus sp. 1001270B_150601_E10]|uniref:hypothetical protein n=1 Tax=Paenibacillus sp. 1001270B_150601_E10 TaxID=2787079 RepID=UPI0018A07534|nr:hypothetical protein [Paenibacillus sp. 1001270B_150601_E10]
MNLTYYVGTCDKSDMLLAVSLLLQRSERKVLLIDGMSMPWLRYRNGSWISKERWTSWNGLDTISGVRTWQEVDRLAKDAEVKLDDYDDIIVDTDLLALCSPQDLCKADTRFFVLTTESSMINRHLEWMVTYQNVHHQSFSDEFQLILMHATDPEEDVHYVEQVMSSSGVHPSRETLVIPYDESDWIAKLRTDSNQEVLIKQYARATREVWRQLVESSTGPLTEREWRKVLKGPRKGSWYHEAM